MSRIGNLSKITVVFFDQAKHTFVILGGKSLHGFHFAIAQNFSYRVDLISQLEVLENFYRGYKFTV